MSAYSWDLYMNSTISFLWINIYLGILSILRSRLLKIYINTIIWLNYQARHHIVSEGLTDYSTQQNPTSSLKLRPLISSSTRFSIIWGPRQIINPNRRTHAKNHTLNRHHFGKHHSSMMDAIRDSTGIARGIRGQSSPCCRLGWFNSESIVYYLFYFPV